MHVRPARWLTAAGLSWAAAAVAAILAVGGAVLAVLGRDVSIFLVPAAWATPGWGACCWPGGPVTRWARCCA